MSIHSTSFAHTVPANHRGEKRQNKTKTGLFHAREGSTHGITVVGERVVDEGSVALELGSSSEGCRCRMKHRARLVRMTYVTNN